jgi:hypothetical protein
VVTVQTGCGQVAFYAFMSSEESLQELKPALGRLAKRHEEQGVPIKAVYVDKCCSYRAGIKEVYFCGF